MSSVAPLAPAQDTNWLSVKAAAERLGISTRQLYRLTQGRKVPFRRLPATTTILFAPADIAEIESSSAIRPLPGRAA